MNSEVNGACLQNSEGKGLPAWTVVCLSNWPVSWKVKLVILKQTRNQKVYAPNTNFQGKKKSIIIQQNKKMNL